MTEKERNFTDGGEQRGDGCKRRKCSGFMEKFLRAMALNDDDDEDYYDDYDDGDNLTEDVLPEKNFWQILWDSVTSCVFRVVFVGILIGLCVLLVIGLVSLSMFGVERYRVSFCAAWEEVWFESLPCKWEGFSIESESTYLSECYRTYDDEGYFNAYEFENDGEFLSYLQENDLIEFYPSNEWTVDEVIAYARAASVDDFVAYNSTGLLGWYVCWTPDYKHCIMLDSPRVEDGDFVRGWICIDGVRVGILDEQTYDISNPDELIAKYQAREWDGSKIYSHDLSTSVSAYDLQLEYQYERPEYSKRQDPQGLAYDGYDQSPWWTSEVEEASDGEKAWVWFKHPAYIDLPVGYDPDKIADADDVHLRFNQKYVSTFLTTDAKLQMYDRGQLLYEWDLSEIYASRTLKSQSKLSYLERGRRLFDIADLKMKSSQDEADHYLYDFNQLYALKKDGSVEPVFEQCLVNAGSSLYGLHSNDVIGLRNQELWVYDFDEGERTLIDQDVLDLYFGRITLYRRADGCYILYHDLDDYDVLTSRYLGNESFDYYVELYEIFWGSPSQRL